jgi:hypothetical protein
MPTPALLTHVERAVFYRFGRELPVGSIARKHPPTLAVPRALYPVR